MNVHISQRQRQHADHKERYARLFAGAAAAEVVTKAFHDAEIKKLRQREFDAVAETGAKAAALEESEARVASLELQLADAQASILRQAETISGLLVRLRQREITKANVFVENLEPSPPKRTVKEIVDDVLIDFPGVTWEDVKGIRRERSLITPRHLCMVAVYEQRVDLSYPVIGRMFHRDHTTIIHAVRKFKAERASS